MKKIKKAKGITLISLIIIIVIMLILATITISLTVSGNLFGYASDAKSNTEIAAEKEILQKAFINVKAKGKVDKTSLENQLKEHNVEVFENEDVLIIKFKDTNRNYEINSNGKINYLQNVK